jgi:hypothetical protein
VLDVPADGFLGDNVEADAFVLHVGRQLHPAKCITFPDLIEFDGVAATAHFLAPFPAIDVVANPPDVGARILLENSTFFLFNFSRHRFEPP